MAQSAAHLVDEVIPRLPVRQWVLSFPIPVHNAGVPADEHAHGAPANMGRACLLKCNFDIDLEHCPQCGGEFKIIVAIEEPAVIVRNLTHLGLPAREPPRSPARPLSLFQAA